MPTRAKKKSSLSELARKHLRALEAGKKAYQRAEKLLEEILQRAKPGAEIPLGEKKSAVIEDLYAEKNRVYRAHGISRYEIKVTEQ